MSCEDARYVAGSNCLPLTRNTHICQCLVCLTLYETPVPTPVAQCPITRELAPAAFRVRRILPNSLTAIKPFPDIELQKLVVADTADGANGWCECHPELALEVVGWPRAGRHLHDETRSSVRST